MAEVSLSLSEAAARYLASLKEKERAASQSEVNRFVRWYGANRPVSELRGHDIARYAETLGPATPEATRRADQVRGFLSFLKREGLTETNLRSHLRLRKNTLQDSAPAPRVAPVEMTREGEQALRAELEALIRQRPQIREEIRRAMMDKDFRENAPLDAAKEKLAHLESRIREIEAQLKHAVIVEGDRQGARVTLGSTVVVRNLVSGAVVRYTIVGAGEASAAEGKISSASPVGRALLDAAEGDEVEVEAPAGVMRFRIERIER